MKDTKPRLVADPKPKPPTTDEQGVPLIVNRRWNVTSLQDEADEAMRWIGTATIDLSDSVTREMLREQFVKFAEHVASRISSDFERAAAKGIAQALNLISDPNYYETVKERKRRQAQSYRSLQEEQEMEARRRRHNPTPEELERDIKMNREWIARDEQFLEQRKQLLAELEAKVDISTDAELLM